MGPSLTPASHAEVCAAFARAVLSGDEAPAVLGGVTLIAAQRDCVRRARVAIAECGGVLIANDVGSGKTFVALALAAAYARPVVLAPAALRTMWSGAMARAKATMPFVSLESLARGRAPPIGYDLVIIDEAHHLRNKLAKTYRAALRVVAGAHVTLLSATPVHNRAAELDALFALFLKADPRDLDEESRARIIVRGAEPVAGPSIVVHERTPVPDSAKVLAAINALPAPIAVRDGGVAVTLMRLSLVRAWTSSVGAFAAMLRGATLRAAALADALRAGRHPTRAELSAFTGDGQLAFAELTSNGTPGGAPDPAALDAHLHGLSSLRDLARRHHALDDERARRLAAIVAAHHVPVLACTQYASTVEAYWGRLRFHAGVCALTSRGARIASGPVSRDEALARFAPVAQGARAPHDRERIHLLIATDLVSEGVNLHDAGVIVHLDVPWTAARLAQRVGRIARMGSPHGAIHTYEFAPPHAAAAALALAARLRTKRRVAARLVGGDRRFTELLGGTEMRAESAAEARARIARALTPFAPGARGSRAHAGRVACAIDAGAPGWLALVGDPDAPSAGRIVARTPGAAPTTNPRAVAPFIEELTSGRARACDDTLVRPAAQEVAQWLGHQRAHRLAGVGRRHAALTQGAGVAATIGGLSTAPPHERAKAAAIASRTLAPYTASPAHESLLALVVFCSDGCSARGPAV